MVNMIARQLLCGCSWFPKPSSSFMLVSDVDVVVYMLLAVVLVLSECKFCVVFSMYVV